MIYCPISLQLIFHMCCKFLTCLFRNRGPESGNYVSVKLYKLCLLAENVKNDNEVCQQTTMDTNIDWAANTMSDEKKDANTAALL